MRLIDADKLEKTLETEIIVMEKCASAIGIADDKGMQMVLMSYRDILNKIKGEETIESIPVEWIEAKMKKLKDMENGYPCLAADILYGILIEWGRERENETN